MAAGRTMRRWLIGLVFGFIVGLAGLGLGLSPLGARFEWSVGLSWLFHLRGSLEPPAGVVVVAIDSRTGEHLGLPTLPRDWPRSVHAELIDTLSAGEASVIVFDLHFGRAKDPGPDQALVEAVRRAGNVVLVELLTGKRRPLTDESGRHVGVVWQEETIRPFPELAEAAAGLAGFPLPKEAASVHRFWVFKESADRAPTLPAVALQLHARTATEGLLDRLHRAAPGAAESLPPRETAFSDPSQLRDFMRGLHDIFERSPELEGDPGRQEATAPSRLQEALAALYLGATSRFINFYGPPGTIPTIPYHSVLAGSDPNLSSGALDFREKVVFVGYSDLYDPGQPDRFYTVFTREDGVDLSGVEIAATGFANLLANHSLRPVDPWIALALLLGFGLLMGLTLYALPGSFGVPIAVLMVLAYALAAQSLFEGQALILPIATPLLVQAPLALFVGLLGQYLIERRRGQRISEAINYYLPADIARDLAQNRLDPGRLNQVVYGACLATDMAGFSTISERLPPGELARFLNDYFETLAEPLKRHGVQVTEFRADAIMCAWTAEQPSPDPRRLALLAALDAGEAIQDFRRRHQMPDARLRIGLEAGSIYVGHAGGGGRFVYSIVGDSANTASRIEGLNKHLGTQILASSEMLAGFDDLVTRYLGDFQFVGKTSAIPIHEVLGRDGSAETRHARLRELFDAGMAAYRAAKWRTAAERLERTLEEFPDDGPSKFFLSRCQDLLNHPELAPDPSVVRMDTK